MIILGITTSHEAGAALIEDGRIVAAINEERLNRKKCAAGVPLLSIQWLLSERVVNPSEIDAVAVAGLIHKTPPPMSSDCTENGEARQDMKTAEMFASSRLGSQLMGSPANVKLYRGLSRLLPQKPLVRLRKELEDLGIRRPLYLCDHHTAHLASAYYTSGWEEALVLSNDGFGDGYCSKVAIGRDGALQEIDSNPFFNSVGMYYLYVTHLCGFPMYYHAGKTMGLAAFGDASRTIDYFKRSLSFDEKTGRYVNHGLIFRKEIERMRHFFNGTKKEDIAAAIQLHLEMLLERQVCHFVEKTGLRRIALAGGVHANVRANQRIAEIPGIEGVFIHPNMGDGGLGAGAGLWLWARLAKERGESIKPRPLNNAYLGPNFDDRQAEAALREAGLSFTRPAHLAGEIAQELSREKIVARCDGRMEYGPRALGNRSILYQATDREVNTWLNKQLKRTEFMPFAPVVRDIDASLMLKNFDERTSSAAKYMTITYDVTGRCKAEAPAVVHVDGTARPQVIRQSENPEYYAILEEYKKRTGLSALVNTSFNMHEEPIVCTPCEAIQAFRQSRLDVLVLNSFLVRNTSATPKS